MRRSSLSLRFWHSAPRFRLSLHLSLPNLPPCLPLFSVQTPMQIAHQRKLRNTLHESFDMDSGQESTLLSLFLPTSRRFNVSPPPPPSGHILFTRPVEVSLFGSRHRSVCADPACYRVLTTKMQWPCFPWLAPVEITTC